MRYRVLAFSIALSFPLGALAQSSDVFRCTMGGLTRRVEVARETDAPLPCEVRYNKDDEAPGAPQVLWSASNEEGYCDAQAEGFLARLEGLGWQCSAATRAGTPATEPAAAEPPADDTDDLLPPE